MKNKLRKYIIKLLIFITTIEVLFNYNGVFIRGVELTNNTANVILQKQEQKQYTITEKYQVAGITIANDTISNVNTGDNYIKQAPSILDFPIYYIVIDGYRYDTDTAKIDNVNSDHEVIFVYQNQDPPIKYYTINESYYNDALKRSLDLNGGAGMMGNIYKIYAELDYNFIDQAPDIPRYRAIDVKIDGVLQGTTTAKIDNLNSDHDIVFIYKPSETYTITEMYILPNGAIWDGVNGVNLLPDKTTVVNAQNSYIASPPRYIGDNNEYVFKGASLDGGEYKSIYQLNYKDYIEFISRDLKIVNADHTIVYVYSPNDVTINTTENTTSINTTETKPAQKQYTITEKYQSLDGINFKNDTISNINAGDNYTKQAPSLQNGSIINIYIDGQSYGPDTAQIANVNSNHEVIFVYNFKYEEQEPTSQYYTINEKYFDDSNQRYMDIYGWSADTPYPGNVPTGFEGFDHKVFSGYSFLKEAPSIPVNETIDTFKYQAVDVMIDGVLQGSTTAVIDNVGSDHDIVYIYRLIRNQYSYTGNTTNDVVYTITEEYKLGAYIGEGMNLLPDKITELNGGSDYIASPPRYIGDNNEYVFNYASVDGDVYGSIDSLIYVDYVGIVNNKLRNISRDHTITYVYYLNSAIDSNTTIGTSNTTNDVVYAITEKYRLPDGPWYEDKGTDLLPNKITVLNGGSDYTVSPPRYIGNNNEYVFYFASLDGSIFDTTQLTYDDYVYLLNRDISNISANHTIMYVYKLNNATDYITTNITIVSTTTDNITNTTIEPKPTPNINPLNPGDIIITGTGTPGNTIDLMLLANGTVIKDIPIDDQGNWRINISILLRPYEEVVAIESTSNGISSDAVKAVVPGNQNTTNKTNEAINMSGNITITFDPNGGEPVIPATKQVTFGNPYGTLPVPLRNGYAFDGWSSSKTGGTRISAFTLVEENIGHTLYAQWTVSNTTNTTIGTTTTTNTTIIDTTSVGTTNTTTGELDPNSNFATDSIIVVLKKSVSEVNKEWQISDFPEAAIESIRDQTKIDGDVSNAAINFDDFHQIFEFTLIDKSKEGVLQAVSQLKSNPYIEAVDPNYYTYPDLENITSILNNSTDNVTYKITEKYIDYYDYFYEDTEVELLPSKITNVNVGNDYLGNPPSYIEDRYGLYHIVLDGNLLDGITFASDEDIPIENISSDHEILYIYDMIGCVDGIAVVFINPIIPTDESITGREGPGTLVIVTFPSGKTSTTRTGTDGKWSVPIPDGEALKPGDYINVIAFDYCGYNLHNSSGSYSMVYDQNQDSDGDGIPDYMEIDPNDPFSFQDSNFNSIPDFMEINATDALCTRDMMDVITNPITPADKIITGLEEPRALVILTFPRGETVATTADVVGKWSVQIPEEVELNPDDIIDIIAMGYCGNTFSKGIKATAIVIENNTSGNTTNIIKENTTVTYPAQLQYTIIEKYQSADRATVAEDTITIVNAGDDYMKMPPTLGYRFSYTLLDGELYGLKVNYNMDGWPIPSPLKIENVNSDHEVIFVYDVQYNEMVDSTVNTTNATKGTTTTANMTNSTIGNDKLTNNIANVILQRQYTITEKYQSADGIIIENDTISNLNAGDNYLKQAPNVLDLPISYILIDGQYNKIDTAQIDNVDSNHEIIFVYEHQEPPLEHYTILESYFDKTTQRRIALNGSASSVQSAISIYTGLKYNYVVEAPNIPRYDAIDVNIDGVLQGTTTAVIDNIDSDHEVAFIYKRSDNKIYTITEKYLLSNGVNWNISNALTLLPDKITNLSIGSSYSASPPRYIGDNNDYIFSLASLDGGDYKSIYPLNYENYVDFVNRDMKNITSDHTIIYVYSPNNATVDVTNTTSINTTVTYEMQKQFTITEKHQSADGIIFANDSISSINAGDNYIKQGPNLRNVPITRIYIDGHYYEPDTAHIENVNSDHEVIFVYDFVYEEQEPSVQYYTINERYFDDANQRFMDYYGSPADRSYMKFDGFDHKVFSGYNFTKKAIDIPINETIDTAKYQAVDVMIDGVLQGTTTAVIDNVNSDHDVVYIYRLVQNPYSYTGNTTNNVIYTITEKYWFPYDIIWNNDNGVYLLPNKITKLNGGSDYRVSPPRYIGDNNEYVFSFASIDGNGYKSIDPLIYEDFVDGVNSDMRNISADHTIMYVYSLNNATENTTMVSTTSINTTKNMTITNTTNATINTTKLSNTTINTTKTSDTTNTTKNATTGTTSIITTTENMTTVNTTNTTKEAITTTNTTNTTKEAITTTNTTNTTRGLTTTANITNTTKAASTTANTSNATKAALTTANTTNTTRVATTTANTTNTTRAATITANTTSSTIGATTTANTTNTTKVNTTTSNTTNTTKIATTTSNTTNTTNVVTTTSIIANTTRGTTTTSNTTKEILNTTELSSTTSRVDTTVNTGPTLLVNEQVTINQGSAIDLRSLILEAKDSDGTDLKNNVLISGEVNTAKAGAYTISFSVTDKNGMTKTAKSVVSVRGEETVIIGDNAIDAHDFSLSVSEAKTITDEQILAKAGVDAWNIPSGNDLKDAVQIDKTQLNDSVGQYKIAISIDLLKATIGKNTRGEDSAIVIATVYEDRNSNNNNVLPKTGENNWMIKSLYRLEKFVIQIN